MDRSRYDAKGQKTQETVTYGEGQGSFSLSTHTHYTATGQKERFTYPDGTQIDYTYTNNGLLHTATLPNDSGSIHWQTYQWQQPTTIILPGAVRTLAYDALQRPIHIKSQAIGQGPPQTPVGQIIMDYRYTYDAAGNITQRQTEEGSYQYAYDLIDRLTHATPPQHLQQNPITPEADKLPVEAYSYDPVHNRLSSQHQPGPWQYNQDNQLQSYGVGIERRSYTYTPNGHTATETTGDPAIKTREFIYNAAERLIEIKDNNQTIGQYQYDPMGRRIKKHTPEGTTWFLYSDEGLIAEVDPTGNPTRYYGWKPNGLWGTDPLWLADKATTAPNTWQPHLYHNDHLWTPQRLTNTQGEVQWSARSEAFGRTAAIINTTRNPLRFPGQYEDEQGLHYNWNRDYNPALGRYVQSDPIGLEGGINNYLYANARPILGYDFNGLNPGVAAHVAICTKGCVIGVAANYFKCMHSEMKSGRGLRECDVECTPTFCDAARDCVTGCIVNVLVPIPVAGDVIAAAASVLAKKLFREMFGADPCGYLDGIGIGAGAGRKKPKPISDFF